MGNRNHVILTSFIVLLIVLSGCKSDKDLKNHHAPLLPLKNKHDVIRLDDGYVKAAIRDYLIYNNAPLFSQYDFTKKDLNNDGLKDALIYLETPYGHWCDIHGCTLLILQGQTRGFSVIGDIKSVRPPFYINPETTSEWKTIDINFSGKKEKVRTAQVFFDGKQYSVRSDNAPNMSRPHLKGDQIFP